MKLRKIFSVNHIVMLTIVTFSLGLMGCSGVETEAKYPTGLDRSTTGGDIYGEKQSLLGSEGFKIIGGEDKNEDSQTGIGVNAFLWRATLDTVSFMPLSSADPFGGVIITDWYSSPEKPDERFKINAFILDKQLRSDGISVKVFRQEKSGSTWRDSNVADDTATKLEDTILTRARQLRIAKLNDDE